jgi:hypothetical protein
VDHAISIARNRRAQDELQKRATAIATSFLTETDNAAAQTGFKELQFESAGQQSA